MFLTKVDPTEVWDKVEQLEVNALARMFKEEFDGFKFYAI